jgi:hypothetical protein
MVNLKTAPKTAIRALTRVEGSDWLRRQEAGEFKGYSVFDAIKELKKGRSSVIYGAGGWNRYVVGYDGSVEFLKLQAHSKKAVTAARKAGFKVM